MASILDPLMAGLGGAASIAGRASQPSRLPVGLGSILGQAGGAFTQAADAAAIQNENLESKRALRKLQEEQLRVTTEKQSAALEAERQKRESAAQFQSILGQAENPADPVTILDAGLKSKAFGPAETTQFISKVTEQRLAREQRMHEIQLRFADQKLAREEREQAQRDLQNLIAENNRENARLAAVLRPPPAPRPTTIMIDGKPTVIDARTKEVIGEAPPNPAMMPKPPTGYQWSATELGKLEPIPGGPAGKLSSDSAGRAAMMDQATKDLDFVESALFNDDGSLNKTLVLKINVPFVSGMPGDTNARKVYSAIENAIAAKLRIETGAATNPSEITNTAARFKPTIGDTAESARDKIKRLREAMKMGLEQMHIEGYISDETYSKSPYRKQKAPADGGAPSVEDLLEKYK